MSGDVQPRKRREKKKKKEDAPEESAFQHQHHHVPTIPIINDDLNIHIQKEASTGGGLCAKLVFFILLSILTTLIGLIITEHRGLTDLDTIDKESRFAQIFDGWIDKSPISHESPEQLSIEESEENHYEEEEEDDQDVSNDENDEETEEDETEETETNEDDDEEEESYNVSEEDHDDDDDEDTVEDTVEETVEETTEDTAENQYDEVSNETGEDEDEDEVDQESDQQDEDDDDDEEEQKYLSEEKEKDEISEEEEDQNESPLVTKEEEYESEEDEKSAESKYEQDITTETEEVIITHKHKKVQDLTESEEVVGSVDEETIEKTEESEDKEAADDEDDDEEEEEDGDDDRDEDEKVSKDRITKIRRDIHSKKTETDDDATENQLEQTENSNMVVKFGVGTALLVVAHVVLVQKWRTGTGTVAPDIKAQPNNTEEKESVTPDLSRRNTIVSPPSLEEIEQDIENVEEEYSENEDGYSSDEESRSKPTRAKMRYQELQSTYSHTLSPNWEPKEIRERLQKDYDDDEDEEEEEEENDGDEDENPEEEEDYDDEISENEDEELLKRLETKYGKLPQGNEEVYEIEVEDDDEGDEGDERDDGGEDFNSWKRVTEPSTDVVEDADSENEKDWSKQRSGPQAIYEFANITNGDDWGIREELDNARQNLANDTAYALALFNKILERHPSSPRALYGKAQSLDFLAEQKRSNALLQEAITVYQKILNMQEVPDALYQIIAERCIDRMRFRGLYGQAVAIHKLLINKFPQNVTFANNLAVTYLTINRINEARNILIQILSKWPGNGFALVHYGFILKTIDNDLKRAVKYLKTGIATKEPGVIDGRFYFHLGDALTRLGKKEDAMNVYSDGVTNKVFLSKYQRSLYNVNRLTGKPWWRKEDFLHVRFFQDLENNWKVIRDEGLNILNKKGYFKSESENLQDVGDWKQFELFARGIKNIANCKQCPITCKIVETLSDATGCRRGQIKFSVMHPGTHVWPHCGPTNCRLRIHLGLKVPLNTFIRVGEEIRSWENGKLLIFDDSFEHEVWHNGTETRLILIIDVWHPELTKEEKQRLSSI